ncbi:MAG: endonuclease III [Chlamydiae bacterium]|nr:MAG: endonuclease III [Chlamydiota bacterium]
MPKFNIHLAVKLLDEAIREMKIPYLSKPHVKCDPFRTLIACILSLRTKDKTTYAASERLFAHADTPLLMLKLGEKKIAKLIYPVGFYNQKSKQIINICKTLLEKYDGKVPNKIDELLKFNGVGRKTANLVVTEAFNKPGICVDTHVHRISNRWGYIKTKTPDETELILRKKLPEKYWINFNRLLVTYGQNLCLPLSPKCSQCKISSMCKKIGVKKK